MYGLQTDQLAWVLGVSAARARALTARWRDRQLASSARLGPGPPWVWLTRPGLVRCGLAYAAAPPALARLAHIRATTAVRLALEAAPAYAAAGARWRSERRLRARIGGRVGLREHFPDGEVHWPGSAPVPWAGECWAIEAELTPKSVPRTAAIMIELLSRTGDYGCLAAQAQVPGQPPRHDRVLYVCSTAARPTVVRARETLGGDASRIEIRSLPDDAYLAAAVSRQPPRRTGRAAGPGMIRELGRPGRRPGGRTGRLSHPRQRRRGRAADRGPACLGGRLSRGGGRVAAG
ncbi:MAG: hypothetical protein ACLQI7_12965, partial [Streptosporangiaceae bacterium]